MSTNLFMVLKFDSGASLKPATSMGVFNLKVFLGEGFHKNICILGLLPSTGVLKFALLNPLPSWQSANT